MNIISFVDNFSNSFDNYI